MLNKKSFLLIVLVVIFIVFYVGYSFSERGRIVFTSSNFRSVNITPQLKSYKPNETIKIEYPLNVGKPRQSIFRPVLGAKLIISTELKNVSSAVYSEGKEVKSGEILQKSDSGMQYRQVKYDIPFNGEIDQTFMVEGEVPDKAKQKITFAHIIIRKRFLFESGDMFITSKKGRLK